MSNETKSLEELAQPVAYDYQIASACIADGHNKNGKWVDWNNKLTRYCPPDWMVEEGKVTALKPLYSQNYIDALLQRIAELEQQRDKWAGWAKELGGKLDAAEKRLATPVRLPESFYMTADDLVVGVDELVVLLREQGFKVEGA